MRSCICVPLVMPLRVVVLVPVAVARVMFLAIAVMSVAVVCVVSFSVVVVSAAVVIVFVVPLLRLRCSWAISASGCEHRYASNREQHEEAANGGMTLHGLAFCIE